jgi:ParB-like chromosome segregation protein Spo0J
MKPKPKKFRKAVRVWTGPTALADCLRPIAELTPDPRNARRHDERNLAAIRSSVTAFGQLRPLVVQKSTGHVVAGNGTLAVLRSLGWTHAAVTIADLTDAQARAFAIADNRTAELAEWDVGELQAALSDPELDGLLDATGWSADEIEQLLRQAGEDQAEAPKPASDPKKPAPATANTTKTLTSGTAEGELHDEVDVVDGIGEQLCSRCQQPVTRGPRSEDVYPTHPSGRYRYAGD